MKVNEASKSKFVYPDKLYARTNDNITLDISYAPQTMEAVEYVRTDAFTEKALKWYCLDCECNDKCKDSKCFFHNTYKRYLEGDTNCLPPKFSGTILNEDGSTSDNWRYRHFTSKMQDAFIEKACAWFRTLDDKEPPYKTTEEFIEGFRNYMKGEKV